MLGFNVCPRRESPLHIAAKKGKRNVVELLVANGADVTARNNNW
jgi:ankyrin repeat protein